MEVVSAKQNEYKEEAAIVSSISFSHFFDFLKKKEESTDDVRGKFYRFILKKFAARPDLLEPFSDLERLEGTEELMHLVQSILFPLGNDEEKDMFALSVPFHFQLFHYSTAFKNTFFNKDGFLYMPNNLSIEQVQKDKMASLYMFILEKFYNRTLTDKVEFIYPIAHEDSGIIRHFKITIDKRFIDIKFTGNQLPHIPEDCICSRTDRILDYNKLVETFPLHLFTIEGFAVWNVTDVTEEVSLNEIKDTILQMHSSTEDETYTRLENSIQAILQNNHAKVGLIPFLKINDTFCFYDDATNGKSEMVDALLEAGGTNKDFEEQFNKYAANPHPLIIPLLNEASLKEYPFLIHVYNKGIRSYAIYPIENQEGFMGVLELTSEVPASLTFSFVSKLHTAFPLLAQALENYIHHFNDSIDKIIKEKFTSIQPSVQWKFNEMAYQYFRMLNAGKKIKIGDVEFDEVYPLYGAIDIRNSSTERNLALTKDLSEQLTNINETLSLLEKTISLPLLEEIKFKISSHLQKLQAGLNSEEEVELNNFIKHEAEPVFRHIEKVNPSAQEIIKKYFPQDLPAKKNNHLYDHHHHDYEESMSMINDALSNFLDKENKTIQQSYPVFFEKYRTDGVEYNIYIGQSIAPTIPFSELYLKNLRLWQLNSMAEAARITHLLLPFLKLPLQTTQLLLIHNHPLTIKFRRDERKFDAEGAYNIRYEIIKKRIDKVHIKNSGERLTQPDRLAIVYTNAKDAEEYLEYIKFLQNKKILLDDIEHLELEELQGVYGLRAIRVGINYADLFYTGEITKNGNPN